MKFRLFVYLYLLLFGYLMSATGPAMAGLIFSGPSFKNSPIPLNEYVPEPGESDGGAFDLTVTNKRMTWKLVDEIWVEANSFLPDGSDSVFVSTVTQPLREYSLQWDGYGTKRGYLLYSFSVDGLYSGEGDIASGLVQIHGIFKSLRGGISLDIDHLFSDDMTFPKDGGFRQKWGIDSFNGVTVVGPGVFLQPSYRIDGFLFGAATTGYAKMRNTWQSAEISLQIVDIPTPPPVLLMTLWLLRVLRVGKPGPVAKTGGR